jgi:hypothetical protein
LPVCVSGSLDRISRVTVLGASPTTACKDFVLLETFASLEAAKLRDASFYPEEENARTN